MKSICIIPARGGSKRIPRKNIKDFLGMPVIAYSIKAAIESEVFDEVMVSTDDEEIAEVAKQYGANIPFLRSKETSTDFATTADVIYEVIDRYEDLDRKFDVVCCIYATAPFITSERLQQASKIIGNREFDSAFSCVAFSYPVLRGLEIDEEGRVVMKWPEYRQARSQDLPQLYHDAGQFYIATTEAFRRNNGFWGDNTAPVILSELEVQDLDTPIDWALAEMKFQLKSK